MKNKATIILITLTILLAGFASSEIIIETYTADFFSAAKPSPTVCACGELRDEIIIRNNAPYPQIFQITTNLKRADIAVNDITVLPRQEIIIPIMIRASCDEKPATEEYDVIIRSTTGAQQIIQRNLEIKECQTIQAKLFSEKNTTTICTPTLYQVTLENPATFKETYLIGPLNNVEWYDNIGYEVTLNPQQKSILNFTFTPSCDISRDVTNEFRIQAQRSQLQADLSHTLLIEPGYNFTLFGEQELNLCRYEKIKIPYTIQNEGLINNTYQINLRGNPRFITLQEQEITVAKGETGTFYLEIEPGFKTREQYTFEIITQTKIGRERAIKKVTLNLNNCYDLQLEIITPENLQVCQGIHELDVLLKNRGDETETYTLGTNTNTATLANNTITLEPQQQKTIKLTINSTIFNQRILFQVTANSTRNLTINWEDSILLDIVSKEDCSRITFPPRYNVYSRYYEENVSITVKNTGIQGETYTIKLFGGDDFLTLTETQAFIDAGQEHTVILQKNHTEKIHSDYYFALEFETSEGQKYNKEYRLIITSTPLLEQIRDYAKQNPCFLVALIIATILILYLSSLLLFGTYLNKIIKIILALIIIIIIIITLFVNGVPLRVNPPLEQPEDPYLFRMYEGDELKINLNEYIIDPDEDPLTFTIRDNATHLNLELNNEILKIQPKEFTGNDRFRITADDGRGGVVTTPRFNVEVVQKRKLTAQETYEFHCVNINLVMLIILLTLILITPLKRKKKKTKKTETKKVEIKKIEPQKTETKKRPGRPKKTAKKTAKKTKKSTKK